MSTTMKSTVDVAIDRLKPAVSNIMWDFCRDIEHSIRFATFVCSDCNQIVWPRISMNDEGFITVKSESIYLRDQRENESENPICDVCWKSKHERRLGNKR